MELFKRKVSTSGQNIYYAMRAAEMLFSKDSETKKIRQRFGASRYHIGQSQLNGILSEGGREKWKTTVVGPRRIAKIGTLRGEYGAI